MTFRDALSNRKDDEDTARLWYHEDETRKSGNFTTRLTGEYLHQDTFSILLQEGWEPVRADSISTMKAFGEWLKERHKNETPDRDQLRREWFDFIKQQEL